MLHTANPKEVRVQSLSVKSTRILFHQVGISKCVIIGRGGGPMVSVLDSGSSSPGSGPGRGHCVVFLGKDALLPRCLFPPTLIGASAFQATKYLLRTCDFFFRLAPCWHQKMSNWIPLNYAVVIAKYRFFAKNVGNGILDFSCFLLRLKNKIAILRVIAFTNKGPSKYSLCPRLTSTGRLGGEGGRG